MPSWKKVIVSGSQAHLSGITSSVLTNDNLLIAGNVGQIENSGLTYNGTTLAIGGASITSTGANSVLTGSFAGTFSGSLSVDLQNLTQGAGITAFTYDGNSPATVAVSGASALSTNRVTKWTGAAFADTTITDNGSIITTTTPLSVGGAITASAVSSSGIISASTLFTPGFVYANTVFPVGTNPVLGDNTSTTEAGRWGIEGTTIELVSNTADWPLIIYTGSIGLGNEIFKIRRDTRRVAINLSNASALNFGLQVEDTFFARASTISQSLTVIGPISASGNISGSSLFITGDTSVGGNVTLGDASGDSVTVNAQTLTLANQLAVGALSSTMLVITSSNRVATQTLGTGVATFLNTPSSANLAAAVTDETGTGTLVFSASPTFTGTVNAANITATGNLIVTGSTTLGDASGDSVTINAATIGIANVGAGTTDTVLIRDGSNTIKTRTIDTRVWGSTLISGSGTANQIAYFNASTGIAGDAGLTYNAGTDTVTVAGDLAVNGGDITTTATNFNLLAGATGTLTIGAGSTNVTIPGNLTVNGTTTILNVDNLLVEDKFILLASGSTSPTDGGIIVQTTTGSANVASGSAFYLETGGSTQRWALAQNVPQNATEVTPTDYMVSAQTAAGNPSSNPTYGGSSVGFGNIYVNSSDESIWIFS
jgi:microcompartment protein CcmK/EutM